MNGYVGKIRVPCIAPRICRIQRKIQAELGPRKINSATPGLFLIVRVKPTCCAVKSKTDVVRLWCAGMVENIRSGGRRYSA